MGISPKIFTGSARAAVNAIRQGQVSAQAYVQHFLDALEAREPQIRAMAYWDQDQALRQAATVDTQLPLAGIPIAVKDVLDVQGMPTAYGAQAVFHRQPVDDAACVARLRHAGAIILGKATTAEFAYAQPPITRNPHDVLCTPGGSSSGSAAGVAAGFFPVSIGTQTGGSIIRPAAFCGVYGFKPTFGRLSRQGLAPFAESFDTVGWFGRHLEDIALLYIVLMGGALRAPAALSTANHSPAIAATDAQQPPRIAMYQGPFWAQASAPMQEYLLAWADLLQAQPCALPIDMQQVSAQHRLLMAVEMVQSQQAVLPQLFTAMSPTLQQLINIGQSADIVQVRQAYMDLERARLQLDDWFEENEVDIVLTLAAPGAAPKTQTHTGNSIFNCYWSALHVPCLGMPAGQDADGMPLGLQLIARRHYDAPLLHWAEYVRARASQ